MKKLRDLWPWGRTLCLACGKRTRISKRNATPGLQRAFDHAATHKGYTEYRLSNGVYKVPK